MTNRLTLRMLGKNFSRRQFEIFSYIFQKIGFDLSCKICMKCQSLFSGKIRKKNINLSSSESVHSVPSVKYKPINALLYDAERRKRASMPYAANNRPYHLRIRTC